MTDRIIRLPVGRAVTFLKSLLFVGYGGSLALLFRTVGWNPPFVFEGAWPDPWRLAVPPVERITPLLGFAFAWPLLMQLLTSSVFTLSAVAAGKASKPSELAAKLRLPGGWAFFSDESTRRGRFARGGGPGDAGTVTLPLVCHADYGIARAAVFLAWAALMVLAPGFFREGITAIDGFLFLVAYLVLLTLIVVMDLGAIASLRLVRVRATDGCAVFDAPEPAEPRIIAVPWWGWRRELAKLVNERLVAGLGEPS